MSWDSRSTSPPCRYLLRPGASRTQFFKQNVPGTVEPRPNCAHGTCEQCCRLAIASSLKIAQRYHLAIMLGKPSYGLAQPLDRFGSRQALEHALSGKRSLHV